MNDSELPNWFHEPKLSCESCGILPTCLFHCAVKRRSANNGACYALLLKWQKHPKGIRVIPQSAVLLFFFLMVISSIRSFLLVLRSSRCALWITLHNSGMNANTSLIACFTSHLPQALQQVNLRVFSLLVLNYRISQLSLSCHRAFQKIVSMVERKRYKITYCSRSVEFWVNKADTCVLNLLNWNQMLPITRYLSNRMLTACRDQGGHHSPLRVEISEHRCDTQLDIQLRICCKLVAIDRTHLQGTHSCQLGGFRLLRMTM